MHIFLRCSLKDYHSWRGCCFMQLSPSYTGVLAISRWRNWIGHYFTGAIRRFVTFLPWCDLKICSTESASCRNFYCSSSYGQSWSSAAHVKAQVPTLSLLVGKLQLSNKKEKIVVSEAIHGIDVTNGLVSVFGMTWHLWDAIEHAKALVRCDKLLDEIVNSLVLCNANENMWPQHLDLTSITAIMVISFAPALILTSLSLLMSRFRSLWHICCQGCRWYKYGGRISNFISSVNSIHVRWLDFIIVCDFFLSSLLFSL